MVYSFSNPTCCVRFISSHCRHSKYELEKQNTQRPNFLFPTLLQILADESFWDAFSTREKHWCLKPPLSLVRSKCFCCLCGHLTHVWSLSIHLWRGLSRRERIWCRINGERDWEHKAREEEEIRRGNPILALTSRFFFHPKCLEVLLRLY